MKQSRVLSADMKAYATAKDLLKSAGKDWSSFHVIDIGSSPSCRT